MTLLIFDAGPIISLTTNNVLWILEELKVKSQVQFAITAGVKRELVDKPLETLRFKFEAVQVQQLIERGVLQVIDDERVAARAQELLGLANRILEAQGVKIQIMQRGEMETIAASALLRADAIVVDERVTRTLLESPEQVQKLMEKRLHMQLKIDRSALHAFEEQTRHISLIRSVELVTVAFEKGVLNKFIVKIPNARRELLESLLWGLKLNGCSVTDDEINAIVKAEKL